MDRVDVKQEVPLPSKQVIYEIFRGVYNGLQDHKILKPFKLARSQLSEDIGNPFVYEDKLPKYLHIWMYFWKRDSVPMGLVKIAEKALVNSLCTSH
jgi:hypothetical protein